MKVLLTGGTGFIGQALVKALVRNDYQVTLVSRQNPFSVPGLNPFSEQIEWLQCDFSNASDAASAPEVGFHDVVINLAGEGIADKRWSTHRKAQLYKSRVTFTSNIIQWLHKQSWKPNHWLNASAIGFYGSQDDSSLLKPFTELDGAADDFASRLCDDWERTVTNEVNWPCRTVLMRFGVVLGKGGMLKKLKPSFQMGLGARLGDGQQGFSWIHLDDLVRAIIWLMEYQKIAGPINLTAPESTNNEAFTQALASALHRPAWLVVPSVFMRLMLGEMAETLLLSGQRVYPEKLEQEGFTFNYPDINTALNAIFR